MQVVGITSQQEVTIGSKERNFRINELLMIEDGQMGDLLAEVVETKTFNRFIPLDMGGDFVDASVLDSLKAMGYNVDDETIYIAKARLFEEATYPVLTGSMARSPEFEEVKDVLLSTVPDRGLTLGSIRNTDDIYCQATEEFKNLYETLEGDLVDQKDLPYILDIRSMHQYPHIGIFGGSGSGKSFGLRVLLEELMKKSLPTVVLDPHYEMDFKNPAGGKFAQSYQDQFVKLQIGEDVGIKFEQLSVGDINHLLGAVSVLTDSMKNVVASLFKKGNNLPTFLERIHALLEVGDMGGEKRYSAEIQYASPDKQKLMERNLKIFAELGQNLPLESVRGISWRMANLEREGLFNKDILPVIENLIQGKLVVVQGSMRTLQMFSTYLVRTLYNKRRTYRDDKLRGLGGDYFPPFFIVNDEAHNFAPKGLESPTKSALKEIAQEGRKYGVFLVMATQRPTLLDETITAQLNTKFIFRTVRASDIDTIREETDLTAEEAHRLPYLRTGDVFISASQMGRTSFARIRAAETTSPHSENPFDELIQQKKEKFSDLLRELKPYYPVKDSNVITVITGLSKAGINITYDDLKESLKQMAQEGLLEKKEDFLGNAAYSLPEEK